MLQGGAYGQFASVPLNLLGDSSKTGDYLVTGQWGDKAAAECAKYGVSNRSCDTKPTKYTVIPDASEWKLTQGAAFVHYCANETVNGVEWRSTPVRRRTRASPGSPTSLCVRTCWARSCRSAQA